MNKEKMMKIADGFYRGTKWAFIVVIASYVILIWALAMLIGWNEPKIQEHQLDVGYATVVFEEDVRPELVNDNTFLEVALCVLLISMPMIIYGMILCRRILKAMKEGTPFAPVCAISIKRFAYLVLGAGIIGQFTRNISTYIRYKNSAVYELIGAERIKEVVFEMDFDATFIFFVGILYLLYYVFKYGEILQQESDETL